MDVEGNIRIRFRTATKIKDKRQKKEKRRKAVSKKMSPCMKQCAH